MYVLSIFAMLLCMQVSTYVVNSRNKRRPFALLAYPSLVNFRHSRYRIKSRNENHRNLPVIRLRIMKGIISSGVDDVILPRSLCLCWIWMTHSHNNHHHTSIHHQLYQQY